MHFGRDGQLADKDARRAGRFRRSVVRHAKDSVPGWNRCHSKEALRGYVCLRIVGQQPCRPKIVSHCGPFGTLARQGGHNGHLVPGPDSASGWVAVPARRQGQRA